MSHASGKVRFADGVIFHVEYDGTTDVLLPRLWATSDEMWDHWRTRTPPPVYPPCPHDKEPVTIAVTYGLGGHWAGLACRTCLLVDPPLVVTEVETVEDGLPDWFEG